MAYVLVPSDEPPYVMSETNYFDPAETKENLKQEKITTKKFIVCLQNLLKKITSSRRALKLNRKNALLYVFETCLNTLNVNVSIEALKKNEHLTYEQLTELVSQIKSKYVGKNDDITKNKMTIDEFISCTDDLLAALDPFQKMLESIEIEYSEKIKILDDRQAVIEKLIAQEKIHIQQIITVSKLKQNALKGGVKLLNNWKKEHPIPFIPFLDSECIDRYHKL